MGTNVVTTRQKRFLIPLRFIRNDRLAKGERGWAGRQSRPAQPPVKLATVIPNEVRDLWRNLNFLCIRRILQDKYKRILETK